MHLVLRFVNALALVAVLVLSAVPAHAHDLHHGLQANDAVTDMAAAGHDHPAGPEQGHQHDDPAVHCGAPLLAVEPLAIGCTFRVSSIAYDGIDSPAFADPLHEDLRPPRA
ncbi:hypothetical protein SAMN06295905_1566 [Devosia lucknowensis]|uniref:Cobalt-zinc-cadmium efflux system protein n=1 Tax=Devosia lucknowensis TaxID=1096929 RepID=A0A1Y6EZG4_9HYPH|nr:hypothetical protein [Devosia lucknowensis]SMQ67659.1 hypothetical protein SAMN06295905_1566 [Devosia lucknowensis]